MILRPFQRDASTFLQSNALALFCDDAGLGKSASVLDALDALGLSRVLCIGPAVAGVSWPIQLREWSPGRKFVNLDLGTNFGFDLPGFYFVSYDMLSQKKNAGLAEDLELCLPWDAIVLDEAQYLKSAGANRTKAVYGPDGDGGVTPGAIVVNAYRVWVLSGTLTPNHAGEAYTHLRALFPEVLNQLGTPEQYEFENKFCVVRDTVYGRSIQGSKNMRELRAAISPILLRRKKIDVMPDLPPMEWFTAPIDADPKVIEAAYDAALQTHGLVPSRVRALGAPSDEWLADLLANDPNMSSQRRTLGLAKVDSCARWIIERLEAGEPKIIVFAHHTAVLDALKAALLDYSPVQFDGRTPTAERDNVVSRFQNDPVCRVFIGQIIAAGTAITLTAAKTVFFAEYAGTPGVNYQAASRAHRMGQNDGVQVYFGSVPNSLDERIARTAARRAREIAELFD